VFITGGTGSIGRALVDTFVKAGTTVSFQYCQDTTGALEIERKYGITGHCIDFSSKSLPDLGHVDILVNSAGINISKVPIECATDEEWDKTLMVNVTVPMLLAKQVLPQMKQQGWGRIINVSSIYGMRIAANNLSYNVSKHALRALTASIAKEYGAWGVTCNEVCPGPVSSNLLRRIAEESSRKTGISVAAYEQKLASSIPVGRLALPQDIANAVLWLASEESSYINGISLPIDGGLTL
jgi:NAD(P)-dependent dehydrogenase (short-subunit alcohol dehydrogenase family)